MALQTDETKGTAQSNVSVATVGNVNTTVMMTSSSEGTDDNSIGVHDDNMTNSDDTTKPKVCAVSCEDARVLDLWENAEDSPMSWQHYTDTDSTRTQHSVRLDRVLDSDGATDTLEMDIATDTLESELCAITGSVSFERLHRSASRQKRIKRFYELLQLHSNGRVDVEQKIWNGDIMMKYKW